MSNGLVVPLTHLLLVAPFLIYIGLCMNGNVKKCPKWLGKVVIGLGVAVAVYHLYLAIEHSKESFRDSSYLGIPYNTEEGFVPFSYPYQGETERYFSYHDKEHTRNCNCAHNDGHTGCHMSESCNTESVATQEGFDTVSPANETSYTTEL